MAWNWTISSNWSNVQACDAGPQLHESRMNDSRIILEPIRRSPLHFQVRNRIEALLGEFRLEPGSRLLSEREFAERLNVSRHSIRQALASLEGQGYVEVRRGSGAYLKATPPARSPRDGDADLFIGRYHNLSHIMEARFALEPAAAQLAASRRDESDIGTLRAALEFMEAEIEEGENGEAGNTRFHHAIWQAARSPVIQRYLERLTEDIARIGHKSLSQTGRPRESLAAHWRILDAIQRADPPEARRATEQHLLVVSNVLLVSDLNRSAQSS